MTRLGLYLALATLGTAACTAGAPEGEVAKDSDDAVEAKSLGGPADDSIVAVTSPNKPSWICSGSVIAPRLVLTAAHCVLGGNSDKTGWSFEVYFGANRNKPTPTDTTIKVKEFHFPQRYRDAVLEATAPADSDLDGDIAILVLEKPTSKKPMTWNREPLTDMLVGERVRFVGYGLDGPQQNPASRNGIRKTATLPVDYVSDGAVAIVSGKANPCHGDSGGPLLLEGSGAPVILGVGHMMNDESCEAGADYERTDKYVDFIEKLVDANP